MNILNYAAPGRRQALTAIYSEVFAGSRKTTIVEITKDDDTLYFNIGYQPVI